MMHHPTDVSRNPVACMSSQSKEQHSVSLQLFAAKLRLLIYTQLAAGKAALNFICLRKDT